MRQRRKIRGWIKWAILFVFAAITIALILIVINDGIKERQEGIDKALEESGSLEQTDESPVEQNDTAREEPAIKIPQYEGESPNRSNGLTGLVSYTGFYDNKLIVRVSIDQFLQFGNCKITIKNGNEVIYTETVNIVESVTTSTCDGFEISTEGIPHGKNQIAIDLESNEKYGIIVDEIDI